MIEEAMYLFSRPVLKTYTNSMLKMDVQWHEPFLAGAKIIVANHPTTTDPFFVATLFSHQVFILINELLFKVPVFGEFLRRSGHIPVVVGNGKAALDTALDRLSKGDTIVVFPEGKLSPVEGGFCEPHTGAARLALMSGAPIIPVGIHLPLERVRFITTMVEGKPEIGRWYTHGPYNMTIGRPLVFHGNVENHAYVRQVSKAIMHHIREMAYQSRGRMQQGPTAMPLPELF